MSNIIPSSTLTWPVCDTSKTDEMPTDACRFVPGAAKSCGPKPVIAASTVPMEQSRAHQSKLGTVAADD